MFTAWAQCHKARPLEVRLGSAFDSTSATKGKWPWHEHPWKGKSVTEAQTEWKHLEPRVEQTQNFSWIVLNLTRLQNHPNGGINVFNFHSQQPACKRIGVSVGD